MFWNSNFQTHHTENRLRGKAGGGGGWARWLLSTDSLLRAWTALGTALNGSWGALVIIPGGRLPFPTVSLKLLAPPPTLPPPWKLFHLLTGPLLATWCPLPGPRSWLVCLCILFSFFLPPLPSLSLSALGHPPQPGRLLFRLHPPFVLPFLLFYPVIRPRNPRLHPSPLPSNSSPPFPSFCSLLPFIQIGMLPRTSSCTSNQKPFMEKLLWGKGFSASVETNSNFRVRFFYFFLDRFRWIFANQALDRSPLARFQ